MSLTLEQKEALRSLNADQVSALQCLFDQIEEQFAAWVLSSSLGEAVDDKAAQVLVAKKYRHEGAMKARQLLFAEIQNYRKASQERLEASDSIPKKGKK